MLAVSGRTERAIEAFHKALSLKRDDAFSNTMLRYVVEKMVDESSLEGESSFCFYRFIWMMQTKLPPDAPCISESIC